MSEPSGQGKQRSGWSGGSADSWERRAADLANEVQRWLIRSSARNMRDELGGQVKKAFRGQDSNKSDVWATATTEPPDAADQPPECAWCPICRAARRIAQAQAQGDGGSRRAATPADAVRKSAGPALAGAADVLVGAARDALVGLDAMLSARAADASSPRGPNGASSDHVDHVDHVDHEKEPDHEPDHRG